MTIEILYKSSFRSVKEYCRLKKYCYIELMVGRKTNKTLPISWTDQWQLVEFDVDHQTINLALAIQHRARRNASFFNVCAIHSV